MKQADPGSTTPTRPARRPAAAPATPRQAARRRAPVDRLLDPELFKALSDPTRVKLLACVLKCSRPCSVTEVAACCSVDFSVVARHLTALARVGLLEATKEGRTVWYAPCSDSLASRLRQLADAVDACSANSCCGDAEGGDRGCC